MNTTKTIKERGEIGNWKENESFRKRETEKENRLIESTYFDWYQYVSPSRKQACDVRENQK